MTRKRNPDPDADTGLSAKEPAGNKTGGSTNGDTDFRRLVVVGSSAGGIQALTLLVGSLPVDFGAPIVLAQHLDPNRPSNLTEILARRSVLPVVTVHENTDLETGHIYVVPSNRHVVVNDGHVQLLGDHEDRPRPSVDLLLTSASASYGDRLIAVILTGSGSDGAAGAVEVKNAGGTVVIQNPQTARYPSMPLALPPPVVDYVVDIEDAGALLHELVRDTGLDLIPETASTEIEDILLQVSNQANIDFRSYKPSTIQRRIRRRMSITHNKTLQTYASHLRLHPEEVSELVKSFLIKVTEFFRDPEAYTYLRNIVLPELIESGRARGNTLRIWSAGCASGEEPYSIALLLADLLGTELPGWSIRIFATDLDADAINFARRGLYPENMLRQLPHDYRQRFFETGDHGFRISKALRQMVIFGQQDLSKGIPFPRLDLVSCRNLLIYFKPELQEHVLDMFAYSLTESRGFLFLGHAENVSPSQASFEQVNKKAKVYKCVRSTQVATSPRREMIRNSERTEWDDRNNNVNEASTVPNKIDIPAFRRYNEVVFRMLPTGIIVIDRGYKMVTINGAGRRLLGVREMSLEQDFLHTVRGLPYDSVRNAIDNAFREPVPISLQEVELDQTAAGMGRYLNLNFARLDSIPINGELVLICVQDVTEIAETRKSLELSQGEQKQLLGELQTTNRRLSNMNKEMQDANEELQSANEELMLAQEELQASNEELETTNEELQATNEELETNNEELHATNEELETTNEELGARTSELQNLTRILASHRLQLSEIIEQAPVLMLVVEGPQLNLQAFNSLYAPAFRGREMLGMSIDEIFEGSGLGPVRDAIRAAYNQNKRHVVDRQITADSNGGEDRLMTYHVVPLHNSDGHVTGVAVYAVDTSVDHERADLQGAGAIAGDGMGAGSA